MRLYLSLVLIFLSSYAQSQITEHSCRNRKGMVPLRGGSVPSDPGNLRSDTLDVLKYDLTLDFTMMNDQQISGVCRLDFRSLMNDISVVHLDLIGLTVDSVMESSVPLQFAQSGESLFIELASAVNENESFSLTVHYHGSPLSDATWGGFYFSSGYAYNLGVAFTSVPHNFGRCWFPCFDNFVERSLFDFHVLTNQNRTAYCNGVRTGSEIVGQDSLLSHWSLTHEIPTYLACVAVTNYTHAEQSFNSISGDEIPIWLIAKAIDTTDMKLSMVNLPACLDVFEANFGPYRWQKVGFCAVPFSSGAMEHATSIAYPVVTLDGTTTYETLFAHELSHHWWGDLVTCRNAYDMWLNEGFARYSEALFLEGLYGSDAYNTEIALNHKDVLLNAHRNDGARYPVSGVPSNVTYGDHVYNKGADIAHTLRSYMGDENFFQASREMMENYQFTDYSSEDLRDFFQAYTSEDLTAFFDDWVFEPGFPEFRIRSFNNSGDNNWQVEIEQFAHYATSYYSSVPIQLTALSDSGERLDFPIHISGQLSSPVVTLPEGFLPVTFFLNTDNALSMAVLAEEKNITSTGPNNLNYAEMEINVENMGFQDSIFVRAENHWAAADESLVQGEYYISPDRWWNVYHNGEEDAVLNGTIRYYGNESDSKYFDPIFFAYLEANAYNEDSLKLMYRPDGNSPWVLWDDFEVQTAPGISNWNGRIRINNMRIGHYAWAVLTGPTDVDVYASEGVSIFRNRDQISLRGNKEQGVLEVFDMNGRLIACTRTNGGADIPTNNWSGGIYVVRWKPDNSEIISTTRICIESSPTR